MHDGVSQDGVLVVTCARVVPNPPESIEVTMMEPEDGVGRRSGGARHGSSHPSMDGAMDAVNHRRKVVIVCLRHRGGDG